MKSLLIALLCVLLAVIAYLLCVRLGIVQLTEHICTKPDAFKQEQCGQYYTYFVWLRRIQKALNGNAGVFASVSGIAVAFFTFTLWRSTERMWQSSVDQLRLAREEFHATHRPRIILRGVDKIEDGGTKVVFTLVNAGSAPGKIVESWALIETLNENSYIRGIRATGHTQYGIIPMAVGQSVELEVPIKSDAIFNMTYNAAHLVTGYSGLFGQVHFAGAVNYLDAAGNNRTSVFRRQWDPRLRGFYRTSSQDDEHAD